MLKLKPQTLRKTGQDQFVVLTSEQYRELQERLQDAEDVLALRAAKARDVRAPTLTLAQVKSRLAARKRRSV